MKNNIFIIKISEINLKNNKFNLHYLKISIKLSNNYSILNLTIKTPIITFKVLEVLYLLSKTDSV